MHVGTARIVRRAGFVKRWGVRPSVRLSVCLSVLSLDRSRGVRRFAAERRADKRYLSTVAGAWGPAATVPQHGAQQQMRTVASWHPS